MQSTTLPGLRRLPKKLLAEDDVEDMLERMHRLDTLMGCAEALPAEVLFSLTQPCQFLFPWSILIPVLSVGMMGLTPPQGIPAIKQLRRSFLKAVGLQARYDALCAQHGPEACAALCLGTLPQVCLGAGWFISCLGGEQR